MNDAVLMSCVQSFSNLNREVQQFTECQGRSFLEAFAHGLALQQLHDDKGLSLVLPEFIDAADVRVVQPRSRLGFTLKALQGDCVTQQLFRKELQSHTAS